MSLQEELRQRLKDSMTKPPEGGLDEKTVLRTLIGEIERGGSGPQSDDKVRQVIKKFISNNWQTQSQGDPNHPFVQLSQVENQYLLGLIPDVLTLDQVRQQLQPHAEELQKAKNSGQATGLANRLLKSANLDYFGEHVALVVAELRGESK